MPFSSASQAPLRADAHAVTDNHHPDHQLRIDRRSARIAVERPQLLADAAEVHEPVDRPQQVIARHVTLEAELVEQRRLVGLALAHHGLGSRCQTTVNQRLRLRPSATASFSTQSTQSGPYPQPGSNIPLQAQRAHTIDSSAGRGHSRSAFERSLTRIFFLCMPSARFLPPRAVLPHGSGTLTCPGYPVRVS